jgi:hypothetical protein
LEAAEHGEDVANEEKMKQMGRLDVGMEGAGVGEGEGGKGG